ncbi:MAG: hypothetical protein EOO91_10730, partial [Pedobacter sp.]
MKKGDLFKFNKAVLLSFVVFLFSPFLSIPLILLGIVNKSKFSLILLAVLFGLVAYIYIPNLSDDKARYFEVYDHFKDGSYFELFAYLMLQGQDFILQSMFYLASQWNISAQYVFGLVTFISMSLILSIYHRITLKHIYTNPELRFYAIILLCLAVPYIDLLSGTRYMFACSFVLMAFYIGLIEKQKSSFILLIIAAFIHFSTLVFIPIFCVLFFFPEKNRIYFLIFCVSLVFIAIPSNFLLSIFDFLGLSGGLAVKKEAYLEGEDFVQNALAESIVTRFVVFLEMIWLFVISVYLLFFSKSEGLPKNIILFTASVINVFYAVPTIFFRYAIVLKLLFVFFLIMEIYRYKQKLWILVFGSILFCIFTFQIISGLPNIIATF